MADLISRAAALDIIDGMKPATGDMGAEIIRAMCWDGVKSCIPAIDAIPVEWLCKKIHEEDERGNALHAKYINDLIWEWHQKE